MWICTSVIFLLSSFMISTSFVHRFTVNVNARFRSLSNRRLQHSDSGNEVVASKPPKKFIDFPFKYRQELSIVIEDLTNMGLGIGRYELADGRQWVVMVPTVLPGERVLVAIYKNNNNFSEADLVRVEQPSEDRVEPLCPYFSSCGGCQYQHMNIEAQRAWKRIQVESLLHKIGGVKNVRVNSTVGTTTNLYSYRAKLTPHYDAPKTLNELKIGFQKRGTRTIIDIAECIIGTKSINAEFVEARKELKERFKLGLPKKGATLLFRECDEGIVKDERKFVSHTVGGIKFSFKAGEFFQNNYFILPKMVDHVIKMVISSGCDYLIDTYCGSGLFALSAAKHFLKVYGIEVSKLAVDSAFETAKVNDIQNAEFLCGESEKIFSSVAHLPSEKTAIVIDPPRKGCDESFLKQLSLFRPRKIVYVSCDPATQARDTKFILSSGYSIEDVTPFDLFPQTRHIENVITFSRQE